MFSIQHNHTYSQLVAMAVKRLHYDMHLDHYYLDKEVMFIKHHGRMCRRAPSRSAKEKEKQIVASNVMSSCTVLRRPQHHPMQWGVSYGPDFLTMQEASISSLKTEC